GCPGPLDARADQRLADAAAAGGGQGGEHPELHLRAVAQVLPGSPWQDLGDGAEVEFRMLATLPAARGRGVGETLVRACIERARAAGAPRLVLSTGPEMTAAHRLYERLGFVRVPERDWRPRPEMKELLRAYVLPLQATA